MKTYLECYACFLRHGLEAARIAGLDEIQQKQVLNGIMEILKAMDLAATPPQIAQIIHKRIRDLSGNTDPYKEMKEEQNRCLLEMEGDLQRHISDSVNPLLGAIKLAGACNAIDMGPTRNWDRVEDLFNQLLSPRLGRFQVEDFLDSVSRADTLLYLVDNAGEIVCDKILLTFLRREVDADITLAVRGGPILNDATLEDAYTVGIDSLARVITTGSDAPGAILTGCSKEFLDVFEKADLVLAKGQGNYEALEGVKKENIFFLLQVKCPVVARDLKAEVGEIVLMKNRAL